MQRGSSPGGWTPGSWGSLSMNGSPCTTGLLLSRLGEELDPPSWGWFLSPCKVFRENPPNQPAVPVLGTCHTDVHPEEEEMALSFWEEGSYEGGLGDRNRAPVFPPDFTQYDPQGCV